MTVIPFIKAYLVSYPIEKSVQLSLVRIGSASHSVNYFGGRGVGNYYVAEFPLFFKFSAASRYSSFEGISQDHHEKPSLLIYLSRL